jgi:hypothetical protein
MTTLSKPAVANLRKELEAALALVAAKTGVDFTVGIIRYDATTARCKIEGVARGATGASAPVSPKEAALGRYKYILGNAFDENKIYVVPSLGRVKVVGYNAKAHKYPFIVEQTWGAKKKYKLSTVSTKSAVAAGAVA